MAEQKYNAEAKVTYKMSRTKAARIPERAFRFLCGIGRSPVIMGHLKNAGYSEEAHLYGWGRLHYISGYTPPSGPGIPKDNQEALLEIDRWDEPNFRRASAALRNRYPSQHAYIFSDLKAEQGPKAILSVQTFLDRVELLEQGTDPEREETREEDKAAIKLLEQRNIISGKIRTNLRELLSIVQSPPELTNQIASQEEAQEKFDDMLVELAMWLDEWTETARSTLTRRSHLISLGLASRRKSKPKEQDDGGDDSGDGNGSDNQDD